MNQITFNITGNTLLNNGIIGVYDYLKNAEEESKFEFRYIYRLSNNSLTIESGKLFQLLIELYYWMGQDYYNTYTLKQLENAEKLIDCNVYLDEIRNKFVPFPKMNTYGLTQLITNNTQGVTRYEHDTTTVKKLEKSDPEKLKLYIEFFKKHELNLLSKLYLNEPYTKITRLEEIKEEYFKPGKEQCYLTGESFEKLLDVTNVSPFFSGLANFNSKFERGDKKISWKALYLSRFSVVHAYFHYPNKLRETLYIYLFSSSNLNGLNKILHRVDLKKDLIQLRSEEFLSNIKMEVFEKAERKEDYTEQFEVAFMLVFSFYRKVLKNYANFENIDKVENIFGEVFDLPPFSISSFRSDSLGKTLRPNSFSNINKLHFIINMFHQLEINNVDLNKALLSFKIIKPSERNSKNSYRLERKLRNKISERFLMGRSILDLIEYLYYRCYTMLCAHEYIGFKDYNQIFNFFQVYETKINAMDKKNQELAINLGKQIGVKMRHHDDKFTDASNAKKGRGDLINLRKARTKKQFLDELIRIDFKYGLSINEELANEINDKNYYAIKQFLIIGALNVLNPAIHTYNKPEKTE